MDKKQLIKLGSSYIVAVFIIELLFSISVRADLISDQRRKIISLGDSYSSGEGIEPFYGQMLPLSSRVHNEDWLAHRSQSSWPGRLTLPSVGTMSEHRNSNWIFAASSGAETRHYYELQEKHYARDLYIGTEYISNQYSVFAEINPDEIAYVTMTLGGNDLGFADIITTAVIYGEYFGLNKLTDQLNLARTELFRNDGLIDRLEQIYTDIANNIGDDSYIIIAGYPQLLNPGGGTWFGVKQSEMINSNVSLFNNCVSDLVRVLNNNGMNIVFVSVEDGFRGHEAYSADPYINPVIIGPQEQDISDSWLRTPASAYSMHPNSEGARVYAECVQAEIDYLESQNRTATTEQVVDVTGLSSIDDSVITEEQAYQAIENYLYDHYGQEFLDNYAPSDLGMGLCYLGFGGGVYMFEFTTLLGGSTIYSMDMNNGITREVVYDSMDGLSNTGYCFNAYDYIGGYAVDTDSILNEARFSSDSDVYDYVMQIIDDNESEHPGSLYLIQRTYVGGYDGDDYLSLIIKQDNNEPVEYLIDDYGLVRMRTSDYYELVPYSVISSYPCLLPYCLYAVQDNLADGNYSGEIIAISDDGLSAIATIGEYIIVPNEEIDAMQSGDVLQVGTVTIEADRVGYDYYWGDSPYDNCSQLYSYERGRPYLTNCCTCLLRIANSVEFSNTEDPSYFVFDENGYNAYIAERGATGNQFLDSSTWYYIQYEMASQFQYSRGTNHSNGYYLIYGLLDEFTVVGDEITVMRFSWH